MSDDLPLTPMKTPKIDMGVFMGIYNSSLDEGMSSSESYAIAIREMKAVLKQQEKDDEIYTKDY